MLGTGWWDASQGFIEGGGKPGISPPKRKFPPPKILLIQLFNRFEFHNSNTIRTKTR